MRRVTKTLLVSVFFFLGLFLATPAQAADCHNNCLYGRRTYCSVGGGGNAEVPSSAGYTCGVGSTCYLGSFDTACPAQEPPAGTACGINSVNGKMTYCSVSCGGNAAAPAGFSCGVGSTCCVSNAQSGTVEDKAKMDAFEFCKQAPAGPQREACEACVGQVEPGPNGEPGKLTKVYTAVGCVRVSGAGLTEDIVGLLLGISGGVALLMILGGAFLLSTSQGESGKVKTAKEMITASVMGLVFIIFSVIILDFVGVKLLRIPGLG